MEHSLHYQQLLAGKEYRCSQQYHGDGGGPTEVRLPNLADDHREYVYSGLMRKYNWTTVVFVVDVGSNPYFAIVGNAAMKDLQARKGYQVDYLTFNLSTGSVDYEKLLRLVRKTTRGMPSAWLYGLVAGGAVSAVLIAATYAR
ncbi:hypothetical protein RvY_02085-1 [Ramazzottius varieornatus]|uniref:Receptor ligand binding region domain-containing protein n=1 Tax=Ramazzottius varieornatus TaxID=947166 RepID=A0A1D1UII0_RAMVA|nr:hypothetical protein RvY_02085-1 [Ramazzottius varieornatus]